MENTDTAWAAGLFEGEGTFCFVRNVAKSVSIQMTDLDILERIQNLFGGSLVSTEKQQEHHKDTWRWTLTGEQALYFVESILPYLGKRRSARANEWLDERYSRLTKSAARSEAIKDKRRQIKEAYQGNLTQQAIADRFGVDRSYVAHVVRGKFD